ncbi:MAG: hypothetical protein ACI9K3_000174, partial [Halovenus sp.]
QHETADRRRRQRIEAQNRVEDSIGRTRRLLESDPDEAVAAGLQRVVDDAEQLLEDDPAVEELNRAHDRFEEILSEVDIEERSGGRLPD